MYSAAGFHKNQGLSLRIIFILQDFVFAASVVPVCKTGSVFAWLPANCVIRKIQACRFLMLPAVGGVALLSAVFAYFPQQIINIVKLDI
ncbi:hypothetical protein [Undibacterium sp.]|jgi:hypothetical protein|uniref:hypothetical protein n=1 Tax=Undibacterium sp. TaxID=1914977 RepID=UPI002C16CBBA|nr:hypothetical protein [Undibacterium sp.]HTD05453.1 hypothetical protein [Undibacterium sp.]